MRFSVTITPFNVTTPASIASCACPPVSKTLFNVKELAGAVERVALFSSDGDYSIIKVSVGNNEIVVSSSSPDVGKGREVIECQTQGETINVAFNSK